MKQQGLNAVRPARSQLARAGLLAGLLLIPAFTGGSQAHAAAPEQAVEQTSPGEADLRPDIQQPYIVKKGDTLWDIANYFFKEPNKWLKIWEQNLYITNPDLIYPGNEIRFSAAPIAAKSGGLTIEKMQPQIHSMPAQRIEDVVDTSMVVTALLRQDFIRPETLDAAGYVLDSPDERLNYGANDRIYLKLGELPEEGSILDVFRTADPVRDPKTGKVAGILVKHLGQIRVVKNDKNISEGLVIRAFEEISRGDRLKAARAVDTRVHPDYPDKALSGSVMYIRNDAAEAGQNQIVGINLGEAEGVKTGSVLKVLRAGRIVNDTVSGNKATLPEDNIGQLIVLAPQAHASIALVSHSTSPINIGDAVRNSDRP